MATTNTSTCAPHDHFLDALAQTSFSPLSPSGSHSSDAADPVPLSEIRRFLPGHFPHGLAAYSNVNLRDASTHDSSDSILSQLDTYRDNRQSISPTAASTDVDCSAVSTSASAVSFNGAGSSDSLENRHQCDSAGELVQKEQQDSANRQRPGTKRVVKKKKATASHDAGSRSSCGSRFGNGESQSNSKPKAKTKSKGSKRSDSLSSAMTRLQLQPHHDPLQKAAMGFPCHKCGRLFKSKESAMEWHFFCMSVGELQHVIRTECDSDRPVMPRKAHSQPIQNHEETTSDVAEYTKEKDAGERRCHNLARDLSSGSNETQRDTSYSFAEAYGKLGEHGGNQSKLSSDIDRSLTQFYAGLEREARSLPGY